MELNGTDFSSIKTSQWEPKAFLEQGIFVQDPNGNYHVGWGELQTSSLPAKAQVSFYCPDFFLKEENSWLTPTYYTQIKKAEWQWNGRPETRPWQEPKADDFQVLFTDFQKQNLAGLKKVVPVTFAESKGQVTVEMRQSLLSALRQAPAGLMSYGFWRDSEGILGATPEILFQVSDKKVSTMALAGTRKFDAPSILNDRKERAEHDFVVEEICKALADLGVVECGPLEEVVFGLLVHLRTCVSVQAQIEFQQLIQRLHPTPALGGYPREQAWVWLKERENSRGRFGAPFGVRFPGGDSLCLVAIRNVQWQADQMRLGTGCGLVAQSEFEREWAELTLKRESVKRNFGWL